MDKYVFDYQESNDSTLEFILDKGTVRIDLKNKLIEKHFFLDDHNRTCSIFLEKDEKEPKFRFYNEYLEIIIILNNKPNKYLDILSPNIKRREHFSVTITDTRYQTQITLFDRNIPLEDLTIKKNGEIVTPNVLLPSLYNSFIKNE
jgi:hypothetical protein